MNNLFRLSLLALAFASCQNSGNRKMTQPVPTAPTTLNTTPVMNPDSAKPTVITTQAPAPVATPTTNTTASAKLNPAHGAPGHNCDLPVGAPLNAPANTANSATAPATNASTQPIIMNTTPPPAPANSKVRLNPAHGAPGHDCGIPVGQPLKS